jgi:hypothetical protein
MYSNGIKNPDIVPVPARIVKNPARLLHRVDHSNIVIIEKVRVRAK